MAVVCILSLLVVVLSQLPVKITAQSLELLYITPLQDRLVNRITIGCYQNTFPVNSPNLMFWVRRQGLAMPDQLQSLVTVQRPQPHQVAFGITQDLEGSYFCSLNNMSSNTLDLVAYPQANITIPLLYIFQSGQSATIDCRVMPGRLSQYYRVSWWNDTFRIATSNPHFVLPGYQLHDNFSLTIDNIQTSDSSSYRCIVTIDDPQISGTANRGYDQSELGSITVVVYDQEQCQNSAPIVGASLAAVVAILIVIIVVVVVVTCSCYYIFKRRQHSKDIELEMAHSLKAQRQQEDEKENRYHEVQWSIEQATSMTDYTELKCKHIKQQTQLTLELLGLSSVQVDSEEEWNEEIEKERNDQVLILLKHIFKWGKRNSSLKQDILDTIVVEFGSKVISRDDTIDIARPSTAGLPNINCYDYIGHSDIPLDTHSKTHARAIASPDEHKAMWGDHGLCTNPLDEHEAMSDDHGFCTNPSCPCQTERIRHLDKLMFGSQSKLGNQYAVVKRTTASPLLELEVVDYVDPPNSNVHFMDDIEVLRCDSNGGRYYNSLHDIHVEVPKCAVPEGMLVKLEVGVALFGAFLFPAGMKAVSPILWLCTHPKEFMFLLPIEVKLPHCLQLTSLADITSLQLGFLKGGHNSDDKGNIPFRYFDQATFQPHSSYGTIHIKHFCYLCLTAKSLQFFSKALFYLIKVVPRPIYSCTWDINFCVVMFLDTCYEAVKNQYDSSYHVAAPVQFKFNSHGDGHSDSICINFERYPTGGWVLSKNTGQLLSRDVVDFEKDLETMKTMHKLNMYPPRFTIEVHGERAIALSCVEIEFTGVDRNLNTEVALPLPGPIQPPILQKTTEIPMVVPKEINQQPPTYRTPAAALNSEPELIDLMDKIAAKMPDQWRDIGIGLGLSVSELNCLPRQGLKPMDCFSYIFTIWKERMFVSYSWRKIIQVLNSPSVGQNRLAADLSAELRSSVPRCYRYTSDGSTPMGSGSSDGYSSPQHFSVSRQSTV